MEVKPGYKQTEVGVIPEEWEVARLGELLTRLANGALYQPSSSTGLPVTRIETIAEGTIDMTRVGYGRRTPELEEYRMRQGDILFSHINSVDHIGKVALYSGEPPLYHGMNLILMRAGSSLDCQYLFFCLGSYQGRKKAVSLARQAVSQASINTTDLKRVEMPVPPLPEQRAIAKALSDVDGLLGGLDRLIAKKRDLKQAAMQQLLTGQTRLPGFHGDWEVKRLGIVATVSKGTQLHSSETDEGGKYAHLNGGITPSSYTYKSNTDGRTIAISEGGNSCGFVQFMSEPYWCGGHCYSVIPNGVDNHFLYHALKGQQSAIMGLRVGSGLPNVQKTGLLNFKIQLPATLPEQTAIASVLTEMDGELALLEQRREKTRALKQAMMQELLTGKTRLV